MLAQAPVKSQARPEPSSLVRMPDRAAPIRSIPAAIWGIALAALIVLSATSVLLCHKQLLMRPPRRRAANALVAFRPPAGGASTS